MRLFVAIPLPPPVVEYLVGVQARLSARLVRLAGFRGYDGDPIRWVRRSDLHVTLKFAGDVADEEVPRLRTALDDEVRSPPFSLSCAGLTCYPPRGPVNVIVSTLEGGVDQSVLLASHIDRACASVGVPRERRAFTPHVTLARVKGKAPHARTAAMEQADVTGPMFLVDEIRLVRSDLHSLGPVYTTLARFLLTAPNEARKF